MDKEALLRPRLPEDDVEIPGVGTVRVRALSRYEVLMSQREQPKGALAIERITLRFGMVDPPMTEDDVAAWQKASPAGELTAVTRRIQELSGMVDGAAKEQYKSVRGESGDGVRVLSSSETVDDSGDVAPVDAPS